MQSFDLRICLHMLLPMHTHAACSGLGVTSVVGLPDGALVAATG